VLPAHRAIEVFSRVRGRSRQVQRNFYGDLDIAGSVRIKVMSFSHTKRQEKPPVKRILPRMGSAWENNE